MEFINGLWISKIKAFRERLMHVCVKQAKWLSLKCVTKWTFLWRTRHTIWKKVLAANKSFILFLFCYHLLFGKLGKAMHFLVEVITFYEIFKSYSNMRALPYFIFTWFNFFMENKLIPVWWFESKVLFRLVSFEVRYAYPFISFSEIIIGVIRCLCSCFLFYKFI